MIGDIGIRGPPDLRWIRPYIDVFKKCRSLPLPPPPRPLAPPQNNGKMGFFIRVLKIFVPHLASSSGTPSPPL